MNSGVVFKYEDRDRDRVHYFLVNMENAIVDASLKKLFYPAVDLSTRKPVHLKLDLIHNKIYVKADPTEAADVLMKAFGYNTGYTFGTSKSYCCDDNGTCSESTTNSTCPKKFSRRGSNAPSAQYIKEGTFCSPVETRFGGVNFPVCEKETQLEEQKETQLEEQKKTIFDNFYPLGGKTRRRKGRKSRKGGRKSRKGGRKSRK